MDQWTARKLTYARKMAEAIPAAMTEEFVDEWKRAIITAFFDFNISATNDPDLWGLDCKEGQSFFKEWVRDLRGYSADEHGSSLKIETGPCFLQGVLIEG